jgi:cell division protein FtsI (penicillin-binding protein 3)
MVAAGSGTRPGSYDPGRRILVMVLALVVVSGALVAQMVRIQIFERDRYVAWGEDQWSRSVVLAGERGDLLDRHGETLAVTMPNPVIWVDPRLVLDPVAQAEELAQVLGRDPAEIADILDDDGDFRYLQRPSDPDTAAAIEAMEDMPGVFVTEEPARFRPNGTLARSVVGVTDVDQIGISGIEQQYDEYLAGEGGRMMKERSIDGRTIPASERIIEPAEQGADLRLTIDRALQFEVERSLIDTVETENADGGMVVITEPATGEILAMASVARNEEGDVVATPDNRAVTWTYEPASVMKALTFSAVIDRGLASPSTVAVIPDTVRLYDESFTDDELFGSRPMTPTDILVRSSNTGTVHWALELGATALHDYLRGFGLGTATGLGFPGESAGLFDQVEDWSGTSIASISLGQGISVTPLQMLAAYNTIANGGLYVAPRLVAEISSEEGSERPAAPPARRVISAETAASVSDMLTRVVVDGTARRSLVPGYDIAAKTGTAQKPQEGGGYTDASGAYHYVATVAGFFPSRHPEFSMIVVIDEPSPEFYASRVSAPLFGKLAAWTLRHYQVSPDTDLIFEETAAAAPPMPRSNREVEQTRDARRSTVSADGMGDRGTHRHRPG